MITTREILKAIEDGGWKLAREPFLKWIGNDRVIVYQHSDYGYSAFEMKIKDDRIVFFRALSPYIEDAKKIEAMTLEEVIIHIWEMAIASVRPDTSPYEGNVIRQNTLKWATFELNERMELSLEAGIRKVAEYLKDEIATQETRSAGIPKLKAHLNAVEKTILQTVINALEEWLQTRG